MIIGFLFKNSVSRGHPECREHILLKWMIEYCFRKTKFRLQEINQCRIKE